MRIVDAHLDLSYNALKGRNVLVPAGEQTIAPTDEGGIPTVGLPDLRAGGVKLICATIFCLPAARDPKNPDVILPGYQDADEAHTVAWQQYDWYRRQRDAGELRFVTDAGELRQMFHLDEARHEHAASPTATTVLREGDSGGRIVAATEAVTELLATTAVTLDEPVAQTAPTPLATILLMEGADPFRTPADVAAWFEAGLRVVGLAWKRTRLAGGTGEPGGLTTEGVALVRELDRFGIIHDTSHLAEEAFWHLLEVSGGPMIASHSNCRAYVPTDRQLSDMMIRALVKRGGVVGINFFDRFLLPPDEVGQRRATLGDVVRHVQHVCDLTGDARHVGLGTDMDGGLGRNEIPVEIGTSADLPEVEDALAAAGFSDEDVRAVMGENWLRYFAKNLPAAAATL